MIEEIKKDFPLLENRNIAYLDSGATTQKPKEVIEAIEKYYENSNANPHRGAYSLSIEATEQYENTRTKIAEFINAKHREEIIFSKNATESLNLIAYSYGMDNLKKDDEVVISIMEHHSNLVPWQKVTKTTGSKLNYMYINENYEISDEEIESKITDKTKMIIINNPNNPTGAVYSKETLEKLCQIARENHIYILADEIYNQLDYENQYVSIASFEDMKDYTIIVNGFSKAYAMTGWRMGYIASSQENIEPILKVHQYTTTSQMTFAQIGMAKAIDQEDVKEEVQHMVDTFHERRTFIMEQLDQCENLSYIKPHGAFYIMVDVSKTGFNGQEFADKLLDYGVAVVPASGFGKDFIDFVRISFASSKENIEEAFVRIRKLLSDVKKAQD